MLANDRGKPHEVRTLVPFFLCLTTTFYSVPNLFCFWWLNFSRNNFGGGSNHVDKSMRDNWSQHAKTHDNFLNQDKFLKSNFLFSLSTQKPCVEGAMTAAVRYVFPVFRKFNSIVYVRFLWDLVYLSMILYLSSPSHIFWMYC